MRKLVTVGCVLTAWLGLAAWWMAAGGRSAAAPDQGEPSRSASLDTGTTVIRVLLGLGDTETTSWDGKVTLDKGELVGVEPWRFRQGARVAGPAAWESRSLGLLKSDEAKARYAIKKALAKKKQARKKQVEVQAKDSHGGPAPAGSSVVPTGILVRVNAPADATLTVATAHGSAAIKLADLAGGNARRYLDGRMEARRVPSTALLAGGPLEQDFPVAVADGKGGAWVAYVEHSHRGPKVMESPTEVPKSFRSFVPNGGGDQVKLLHFDGKSPGTPVEVTGPGLDVWRPSVALDGRGRVVVAWSEQRDGNWDLYARTFDPQRGAFAEPVRLTTNPGTDTAVALATAPDGTVWMAWQAWSQGQADVLASPLADRSSPINVSNHPANDWSPAIAVDSRSRVHVAFDSYRAGNYDVLLASDVASGARTRLVTVAGSSRFEARPSLAIDPQGRVWVGYEERAANWGKDFGRLSPSDGAALYGTSAVRVCCVDGERVLDAGDPVTELSEGEQRLNAFSRLACDAGGRIWLLFRHRHEAVMSDVIMTVGGVWVEYATCLAGRTWQAPQPIPRSDGLLDNRPAAVATPDGSILVVYNTDNRMHLEVERTAESKTKYLYNQGAPPEVVNNDLFVAALRVPGGSAQASSAPGEAVAAEEAAAAVHPNEPADIARMRAYRVEAAGKTYRLLRGEFHRHSEISFDGGGDGPLEDLWRYAIDAGGLDWMGDGDHDNGGGKEYTWWLVQKTTDFYHNPGVFMPMFTYERSVQYPGGHRNVMFPYRGVRTLSRLVDEKGVRSDVSGKDEDAAMLFAYLTELGGICASHTSATSMGTDWRANDPKVEPIVEIYQGARESYEHLGSPRVAHGPDDAAGGWKPLGMIWNALAMQYKFGFQASSDHVSTHISFAVALAEEPSRQGIFEAFSRRHCYAATDNIVLDVRSGEHLMGDEFDADGPLTLRVIAQGTRPIKKVDIIKDFVYAYSTEPKTDRVSFTWTDLERDRPAGVSWYYVRVEQEDGELAWGSPMWVRTRAGSGG
jgi:hypothetical protein